MDFNLFQRRIVKLTGTVWLFGISPIYILIWTLWRFISLPLSDKTYQKGDDVIYSIYQLFVIFFYEHINNADIHFTGDYEEITKKKENVILFCNHQSTFDWMIANMLAIRQGAGVNTSIGKIRYMLKDSLKWAPLYGFYFRQHNCIYIKRNNKASANSIESQLKDLVKRKVPYWMVVFPEGTRFIAANKSVIEKSNEFARKNGIEQLKYHLTPRTRGLQMSINELRPTTDAIYDITIAFAGESPLKERAPSLLDFLTARRSLHINIRRIAIDDMPSDDITSWLMDSYYRKDKLLDRFYKDGYQSFADNDCSPSLSPALIPRVDTASSLYRTLPAFAFWLAVTVWFLAQGIQGCLLYVYIAVATTLGGWIWVAFKQWLNNYY